MSSASSGFGQGLQRATETRFLAFAPGMPVGRSRGLSARGRPSGAESSAPTALILKGPV